MDIRTERLNEAFRASGLSQTELCKRTGINKGAMSSYLSGRYFPKQRAIELLADALNVSIPFLMGYDESVFSDDGITTDYLTDGVLIEKVRKLSPSSRMMLDSIIDTLLKGDAERVGAKNEY